MSKIHFRWKYVDATMALALGNGFVRFIPITFALKKISKLFCQKKIVMPTE